jgi:hypothetical protein
MSRRPTYGAEILSALLLGSCGQVADETNESVTAKLPTVTTVTGQLKQAPESAGLVPENEADNAAGNGAQPAVGPDQGLAAEGSRYSSLDPASCKRIEETSGAESARRRCAGLAGFALEMSDSGPTRSLAIITPNGDRSELDLSAVATTGTLGKLAEWRGGDARQPRTLIVRVGATANRPASGRLLVARLDEPRCIVAVIAPGPGQNEKARLAADREQLDCSSQ